MTFAQVLFFLKNIVIKGLRLLPFGLLLSSSLDEVADYVNRLVVGLIEAFLDKELPEEGSIEVD